MYIDTSFKTVTIIQSGLEFIVKILRVGTGHCSNHLCIGMYGRKLRGEAKAGEILDKRKDKSLY